MKKIIKAFISILTLSFLFLIQNSEAQWIRQNSETTTHFSDVQFINRYTGWVCGENKILKTTNGGINWIMQSNPAQCFIEQIYPVDSNVVYAAGWFTMLKTTNGGENWNAIFAGTFGSGLPQLEGVYFINPNTGWFCGNMKMFKTTNGCNTLDTISINGYMHDIYFRNEMEGVSCGEFVMYKTSNGGNNWFTVSMPGYPSQFLYYRLSFINDNIGWIAGASENNRVFKTTNFGASWDSVGRVWDANVTYCVRFTSPNIGYSGGTFGMMFKTTNGGVNWRQENIAHLSPGYTLSIWAYNDSIIWATGGGGMILHTTNGGEPLSFISNQTEIIADDFQLHQNYPNPFNPVTRIRYELPICHSGEDRNLVKLAVYDVMGREVEMLVNERQAAGSYEAVWDGTRFASGVYFYRLTAEGFSETRKMLLVR